jgi:hypothetical protein
MRHNKVEAEGRVIRSEQPGDMDAIGQVHRAAFPTDAEARLVEKLRQMSYYNGSRKVRSTSRRRLSGPFGISSARAV